MWWERDLCCLLIRHKIKKELWCFCNNNNKKKLIDDVGDDSEFVLVDDIRHEDESDLTLKEMRFRRRCIFLLENRFYYDLWDYLYGSYRRDRIPMNNAMLIIINLANKIRWDSRALEFFEDLRTRIDKALRNDRMIELPDVLFFSSEENDPL